MRLRINKVIIPPVEPLDEQLPEYPDRGCDLAPHCLDCPLPHCRFDTVDGKQWRRRPKGIPNRRQKRRGPGSER